MTYNSKQQKRPLTESDALSRKLLLREGIIDTILRGSKKLSRMYHGSDEPFDAFIASARASREGNYHRLRKSGKDMDREANIVKQQFLSRQSSLHPSHPERLEQQFRAETGNPHVHNPVPYARRIFDPAAEYMEIQADPVTHAGGSTDPRVWRMVLRRREQVHNQAEDANEVAHNQRERQTQQNRENEFKQFGDRKFREHVNNIISTDYNHPLTAAKRVFDRDKMLYNLAYKTGGKIEKYRRSGDIVRGLLSYNIGIGDSPAARIANIVGHQLRTSGKQQELSPPGVSEPFGSGDSEHGPR